MDDIERRVDFAFAYPFERPDNSYLYRDGAVCDIPDDIGKLELEKRIPVLAYGSNASPLQLRRKFGRFFPGVSIPVLKGTIRDFDFVYAAMFAPYGSIPATISPSKNTEAEVFVTYLTGEQLEIMHKTEGAGNSYSYGLLHDIDIRIEAGFQLNEVYTYVALRGAVEFDGGLCALAEIQTSNRRFTPLSQPQILDLCWRAICPYSELRDFIISIISDPTYRWEVSRVLALSAVQFECETYERII